MNTLIINIENGEFSLGDLHITPSGDVETVRAKLNKTGKAGESSSAELFQVQRR